MIIEFNKIIRKNFYVGRYNEDLYFSYYNPSKDITGFVDFNKNNIANYTLVNYVIEKISLNIDKRLWDTVYDYFRRRLDHPLTQSIGQFGRLL